MKQMSKSQKHNRTSPDPLRWTLMIVILLAAGLAGAARIQLAVRQHPGDD